MIALIEPCMIRLYVLRFPSMFHGILFYTSSRIWGCVYLVAKWLYKWMGEMRPKTGKTAMWMTRDTIWLQRGGGWLIILNHNLYINDWSNLRYLGTVEEFRTYTVYIYVQVILPPYVCSMIYIEPNPSFFTSHFRMYAGKAHGSRF